MAQEVMSQAQIDAMMAGAAPPPADATPAPVASASEPLAAASAVAPVAVAVTPAEPVRFGDRLDLLESDPSTIRSGVAPLLHEILASLRGGRAAFSADPGEDPGAAMDLAADELSPRAADMAADAPGWYPRTR